MSSMIGALAIYVSVSKLVNFAETLREVNVQTVQEPKQAWKRFR